METRFVPIDGPGARVGPIARSRREPVLGFKHDPFCSISRVADRRSTRPGGEVPTIDVARAGAFAPVVAVAVAVAVATGVWHESPQVLVPREGEVGGSASHVAITADAVAALALAPAVAVAGAA